MSRRAVRSRVSFSLARADAAHCHVLGVNCLALDEQRCVLYSGGRDATVRAWAVASPAATGALATIPDAESRATITPAQLSLMRGHTDWINDLVLLDSGRLMLSASSDATLKLWSTEQGELMANLRKHIDYVKAMTVTSPSSARPLVASAGLDGSVWMWDMEKLVAMSVTSNRAEKEEEILNSAIDMLEHRKGSIYSIACNTMGTLIATGSPEKLIRIWDPRVGKKVGKLVGHTDNIKSLHMYDNSNYILSASSDATVKLWDIGQQRCIKTFDMHDSPVWTVAVNKKNMNEFYSGDRDGYVFCTNVDSSESKVLFKEDAPVHKLCVAERSLWVATNSSSIHRWDIDHKPRSLAGKFDVINEFVVEPADHPSVVIPGGAGIEECCVLDDRQHILSRDNAKRVELWNVVMGSRVKDLGTDTRPLEKITEEMKIFVWVPPWFTVDTKFGAVTVHLEETSCFNADLFLPESGLEKNIDPFDETRVNLGCIVLNSLFKHYMEVRERLGIESPRSDSVVSDAASINTEISTTFKKGHRTKESVSGWIVSVPPSPMSSQSHFPSIIDIPNGLSHQAALPPKSVSSSSISISPPLSSNATRAGGKESFINDVSSSTSAPSTTAAAAHSSITNSAVAPSPPASSSSRSGKRAGANGEAKGGRLSESGSSSGIIDKIKHFASSPRLGYKRSSTKEDDSPSSPAVANVPIITQSFPSPVTSSAALPTPTASTVSSSALSSDATEGLRSPNSIINTPQPPSSQQPSIDSLQPPSVPVSQTGKVTNPDAVNNSQSLNLSSPLPNALGISTGSPVSNTIQHNCNSNSNSSGSGNSNSGNGGVGESTNSLQLQQSRPKSEVNANMLRYAPIPSDTVIYISEEPENVATLVTLLFGTVGSLGVADIDTLTRIAPTWLSDYLFKNKFVIRENTKLNFLLRPDSDDLPALNSSNNRFSAFRILRIRRVISYLAPRLPPPPRAIEVARTRLMSSSSTFPATVTLGDLSGPSPLPSPNIASVASSSSSTSSSFPFTTHGGSILEIASPLTPAEPVLSDAIIEAEARREVEARPDDYYELLCNGTLLSPHTNLGTIKNLMWKKSSDLEMSYRYRLL